MTLSFTGRKRLRKNFGKIQEIAQMPNLIEVQRTSYDQFLQLVKPEVGRRDEGLEAVFRHEAGRVLAWFDRSGKTLGTLGAPDANLAGVPSLSPDGRHVALIRRVQNNDDIWVLDGERMTRFTFDPGADAYPIWSPDGNRIVFDSNRKGHRDLRSAQGNRNPRKPRSRTEIKQRGYAFWNGSRAGNRFR